MSFLTLRAAILLGALALISAVRAAQAARPAKDAPVRTYLRVPGKPWIKTDMAPRNGVLTFHIDPRKLRSDKVMLLVNPPSSLDLNDSRSPELAAASADGKALKPGSIIDLGVMRGGPRKLTFRFRDVANALDPASLSIRMDGRSLPRDRSVKASGKILAVSVSLPRVEWGPHRVEYRIADMSPQANLLHGTIRFSAQDPSNKALAAQGAKVTVDSCFPNYESLAAVNDGFSRLSGESCGSDVTWASAETPEEHWVAVTFPAPQRIRKVTVTWAYHTHQAHSSRRIEIQIPKEGGWQSVYRSPGGGEGESRTMTFTFPEATTRAIRLWQPAGGGSKDRPNLLWIAEIEAR